MDVADKGLTNQGVSLDLVGACDAADMVRLETLTADNGGGYRFAEANVVRDRRANISQSYGGRWKEWLWNRVKSVGSLHECREKDTKRDTVIVLARSPLETTYVQKTVPQYSDQTVFPSYFG